jgi:hypothetical protein
MKTSITFRTLLPMTGFIMSSCQTSGQLLAGGVCTGVALGTVAIATIVSVGQRLQKSKMFW